jgi:predicted Rossmann fold nucleotide-binding protein DprA/Smf involved in DNA uptake
LLSLDIAEVHRDLVKLEIDGLVMRHDSGCWIRA